MLILISKVIDRLFVHNKLPRKLLWMAKKWCSITKLYLKVGFIFVWRARERSTLWRPALQSKWSFVLLQPGKGLGKSGKGAGLVLCCYSPDAPGCPKRWRQIYHIVLTWVPSGMTDAFAGLGQPPAWGPCGTLAAAILSHWTPVGQILTRWNTVDLSLVGWVQDSRTRQRPSIRLATIMSDSLCCAQGSASDSEPRKPGFASHRRIVNHWD